MEKDLRDAYAALKLLRADLVQTRRDKRALEASLTHLKAHGPPPSAAQIRESRETQQMQHEDARAQLWRQASIYESRLAEMEIQLLHNNCQNKEATPEVEDNQQGEEEEVEKLALLNKLHSLTATVKQQTQTMLTQQAAFALQKGELETTLEDTQHQLQSERNKAADALLEQQAAEENYEFLETQVEILKQDKKKLEEENEALQNKLAAHAQTSSILKQQLEEKEEKEKELRDEHNRETSDLQHKYELLELELNNEKEKKLQDQATHDRYASTLREFEKTCEDLQTEIAASEAKRSAEAKEHEAKLAETGETYASKLEKVESELKEARKQLAALETSNAIEQKEQEAKLEEALGRLRDQEQQAMTLRDLENNFADVQSKLTAAETKLADGAKKYEQQLAEASQKLLDQEQDHKRHASSLRDVENDLAGAQTQLADTEAKLQLSVKMFEEKLAQTSQLAAQHEKTARVLAMEKKALQQEVREARQASKAKAEELLKYQSFMEQKTLEYMQCLNLVQAQCESLETQLLSVEDHKESSHDNQGEDSYLLKAFHGLSDPEIIALPPSKSWSLLRSGITELGEFLPQLQTLISAVSDMLALCESHAASLPTLCERLEGKIGSEMDQPILVVTLRLVRFAVMLKTRIQQEEAPVSVKSVQALRRRVLDALAQWYECDAGDSDHTGNGAMPTPTFTTTSRETALILQNWTSDRTKQIGVRRWLARMEAYPGVPPLRGASSNRVLELPPEGCTLELEAMTPEVKDAFLLLLIPILKQNRALHVRVFTRYIDDREIASSSDEDTGKLWAMRIHVQSAVAVHAHKSRPAPLKLTSSSGSPSPLAPNSPASSVSSSTSSSASSRLQIIQERLQYLHNNA
ncbi:hypothetical protein PPTG_15501 [Phytophthora nicotianae INRA-310]|uniref:Uncharacterized protein n=1 Tax=Phytophthora nicotianae (strain INRA-310) TaxID=761204 RepID=W2PR92_PHYN3|nr:hypothetical protein PPTG_15501 [Phytophthora nicotianae INRA-310]ETN02749.1 hypothetical protein PPTG_15501 [Phytophthora nicotianae INRA-310]